MTIHVDPGRSMTLCAAPAATGSGFDRRVVRRALADHDLARLGPLGDRHDKTQQPTVVVRLDVLEIQVVPEHELAAEGASNAFGGEHLPVAVAGDAFGPDGED